MSSQMPAVTVRLALGDNPAHDPSALQRASVVLAGLGLLALLVALAGPVPVAATAVGLGLLTAGTLGYVFEAWRRRPPGVDLAGVMTSVWTARGWPAWLLGVLFTGFYCVLYWWPAALAGLVAGVSPLSEAFRGMPATLDNGGQWFLYGTLYTLAVLVMGARALVKYRHARHQVLRTLSVMTAQTVFAFAIPYVLVAFQQPEFYFSYFWPLKYDYLWPGTTAWLSSAGAVGYFMVFWGAAMSFVAVPVLTYFFGKRWYCSWVCGCGGLAETAGDPYRHLSDKSLAAWRVERWMIHSVLVFVVVTTALLWVNSATEGAVLGGLSQTFSMGYGFAVGAVFSGVVGVGFYPVLGSRVWCRFGCPLAAILGLQQRFFSRFRITTNGGQCISCGNCSAYCEMGIDVKWYAQRGQNVVRSSCVGCGICATVCPRGVLRLENGPRPGRFGAPRLDVIEDLDILDAEGIRAAP